MLVTTRRAMLAGVAVAAAGTVAAAAVMRKPRPTVYTPVAGAAAGSMTLQGAAALVVTEPAHQVAAFGFTDAAGAPHEIAEFAGKGVVLNLWATWCVPCVAELPALAALAKLVAAEGIVVVPLSSDRGGVAVVERFFSSHGIAGLDIWLDPKGAAGRALAARGVPTTVIIDRVGQERARLEGPAAWAAPDMLAAIRKLTA